MRRLPKGCIFTFVLLLIGSFYSCSREEQKLLSHTRIVASRHLQVEYSSCYEKCTKELLRIAENAYEKIGRDLRLGKIRGKMKICFLNSRDWYKVHPTIPRYLAGVAPKETFFVHGNMLAEEGIVSPEIQSTIAHELTHMLYFQFVGRERPIPRWFTEGIAVYEQPYESYTIYLRATPPESLLSLEQIESIFTGGRLIKLPLIYAGSYTAIQYICDEYGIDKFTELLRHLRKKKFDRAFKDVLGMDLVAFESGWRAYVLEKYRFGSLKKGKTKDIKTEHFLVHLSDAYQEKRSEIIKAIQSAYDRISHVLEYSCHQNIPIYILTLEGFLARFPNWYGGESCTIKDSIIYVGIPPFTLVEEKPFMFLKDTEAIFCRLFFKYFCNEIIGGDYRKYIPGLFGVGIPEYEVASLYDSSEFDLSFLLEKEFYSLEELSRSWHKLDYKIAREESKKFIEFLVKVYGSKKLALMIHKLRDESFDKVIEETLGKNLEQLEHEFIQWIGSTGGVE